ncbi:hypothetical protein GCM10023335_34040 [Streptomyces siamensis]|uniref:Prenyltransferase n=1 Tax=Streptomyces siamensis TaxID=1274986 RepID=A0ABP9IX24_9ACTN
MPGDALAGAAAIGARPNSRTLLAIGSSVCLYEAGMALNDWADRAEDAVERPHRPLPSGRVRPAAALAAAGVLTAAGLALASRAGRPSLAVAAPLAATVWAYDLFLKRTPAGPAAMAAARGLDVLLGASATAGPAESAGPTGPARRTATAGPAGPGKPARTAGPAGPAGRTGLAGLAGLSQLVGPAGHAGLAGLTGLAGPVGPVGPTGHATRTGLTGLTGLAGLSKLAGLAGPAGRSGPSGPVGPADRGTRGGALPGRTPGVTRGAVGRRSTAARRAVPSALALATHTFAVTTVSRGETQGGSPVAPLAALATTGALAWSLTSRPAPGTGRAGGGQGPAGATPWPAGAVSAPTDTLRTALALAYAATSARPLLHAALNPSPPLVQRAVGGGIRAMIPLQATLAARAGAPVTALLTAALAPAARRFARKVSVT